MVPLNDCNKSLVEMHLSFQRSAIRSATEAQSRCLVVSGADQSLMMQRARDYYEDIWTTGRVISLDAIMAEDHEHRDVVWQPERVGQGLRQMKRGILAFRASYPDLAFTVQSMAASENEVFVSWEASGTNTGRIHDQAPTGETVKMKGITRLQFDDNSLIKKSYVFRQAPLEEITAYTSGKGDLR